MYRMLIREVDSSVWLLQEILSFSSTQGGADTPARITGDSYRMAGKLTVPDDIQDGCRPIGHNHSGPGRWRPFSRTKKTELRKPYVTETTAGGLLIYQ
ncbi:UNVERIFIED_CONTAM: hypothetical protein Scaly_3074600 [Sesamum calycinum]|uniref:Uncharacterized protein n=1 Tax=Sesamum calycinum TaxID=2727403 RepID=A0AAW2JWH3_9LAMI